ncbi:hypothetical protein [Quadrisphaera sp. KR29]|uniref:hypothetical protein n=1 Tax=Quadrisphaera sp. KR29 TaxID=3461391 RepID=UPI004043FFF8
MAVTSGEVQTADGLTATSAELRRTPLAPRRTTGHDVVRWALAAGYAVLLVVALAFGARPAHWGEVEAAVASGDVTSVTVATAPDDGSPLRYQRVTWREGLQQRRAEVVVVPPTTDVTWVAPRTELERDAGEQLRALAPDLRVERVQGGFDGSSSFWGRLLPFPAVAAVAVLLGWACWLGQLVNGPAPWRATRWAWSWLSWVPGGVLAQLLLGGPTRWLPAPRRPARRLGPWRAFFLSLLLAPLVGALLGLAQRVALAGCVRRRRARARGRAARHGPPPAAAPRPR